MYVFNILLQAVTFLLKGIQKRFSAYIYLFKFKNEKKKKKQFVKYVQNEQQRQQNKAIDVLLMTFLLNFYVNFTHCSNVSILNFKQRNELAHSSHSQYNEKSMSNFFYITCLCPHNIFDTVFFKLYDKIFDSGFLLLEIFCESIETNGWDEINVSSKFFVFF